MLLIFFLIFPFSLGFSPNLAHVIKGTVFKITYYGH